MIKTKLQHSVIIGLVALLSTYSTAYAKKDFDVVRAAAPDGAIEHIMVIDLENESFSATFGANSPAVYLNSTLLKQGQLIPNYFATSHVSLGNYLAQVSGQGPTEAINNDCINLSSLSNPPIVGGFTDILPGNDAADQGQSPGQIVGDGCVFPAAAKTIGDQLDTTFSTEEDETEHKTLFNWRSYAEDMGDDPVRDYGAPDPLGGTTCAHAPIDGVDNSNSAAANDQYATRHNPFVYFHSIIDDQARCDSHVVPLGKLAVGTNGAADVFKGHLYNDLRSEKTTPKFMFVTPNLCNDGHDAACKAPNVEDTKNAAGQNIGGLVSADLWLKHWMPMVFNSPTYKSGKMLVVLTFDESGFADARACEKADQLDCLSPTGVNLSNPGYSPILGLFHLQTPPTAPYVYAGGGQVGAVLFNKKLIKPGTVNTTGSYNHYSALRSYEDLLGIRTGDTDGYGHLGFASMSNMPPFGKDVFNINNN
jgi:hypothetical protein